MFRPWKRILAVLAAVVLPIASAMWSAILSKLTSGAAGVPQTSLQRYLPYAYVGAICLLSLAAAYFTYFKPARDLEKPVRQYLDALAENPLKQGAKFGIDPRINLMIVERPWYRLWQKRIRVVWSRNMESWPDVKFQCAWYAGVSGQALQKKLPALGDCAIQDKRHFRLTAKQLAITAHVNAVWSWPIYERDKNGEQTGTVIGVLNLDGTADGSFSKITENAKALEKYMRKFAEVASTII